MTVITSDARTEPPPSALKRTMRPWPWFVLLLVSLGAMGLSWQGGAWAVAGTAGLALVAAWAIKQVSQERLSTVQASSPDRLVNAQSANSGGNATASSKGPGKSNAWADEGYRLMINGVVPLWARQLDVTRKTADGGLAQILQSFSEMTISLDDLMNNLKSLGAVAAPGAVDAAIHESDPALQALCGPALRACELREAAVAELTTCGEEALQLEQLANLMKELGKHTRLVAFNASIEASRGGQTNAGFNAVASEMRALAGRMSQGGLELGRLASTQRHRLESAATKAITDATPADELRLQVQMRAREAMQMMMSNVGASLTSSSSLREASTAMRDQLDTAMVNFQFGDRVSQMLIILGSDMEKFVQWTANHPSATRDDVTDWLRRLEASYTMDEQRSEHHGNAHVDRGSEVEFF
jgi:methyl-accepting chemotaxis protein